MGRRRRLMCDIGKDQGELLPATLTAFIQHLNMKEEIFVMAKIQKTASSFKSFFGVKSEFKSGIEVPKMEYRAPLDTDKNALLYALLLREEMPLGLEDGMPYYSEDAYGFLEQKVMDLRSYYDYFYFTYRQKMILRQQGLEISDYNTVYQYVDNALNYNECELIIAWGITQFRVVQKRLEHEFQGLSWNEFTCLPEFTCLKIGHDLPSGQKAEKIVRRAFKVRQEYIKLYPSTENLTPPKDVILISTKKELQYWGERHSWCFGTSRLNDYLSLIETGIRKLYIVDYRSAEPAALSVDNGHKHCFTGTKNSCVTRHHMSLIEHLPVDGAIDHSRYDEISKKLGYV